MSGTPILSQSPASLSMRLVTTFGLMALALFIVSWIGSPVPAQDNGQSNKKEEKEEPPAKATKKQGKKQPKEEEEEPGKTKRKPLIRVGDEDEDQAADKDESGATSDLERDAEKTKNPVVRELLRGLSKPHDVVTALMGRIFIVAPIPQYVGNDPQFKGTIGLKVFDDNWKRTRTHHVSSKQVSAVDPYEHVALA